MRVILLQDIKNLGKKYEIKEVADGYARNSLIPQNLAKPANKAVLAWVEMQKEIELKKSEEELKKTQDVATLVDGQEVVISVKIGDKGQFFEAINAQKIAEKLKAMNFEIKKNQINLAEPIKELGEYPVKINFDHNLEAEIRIIVVQEKEEG